MGMTVMSNTLAYREVPDKESDSSSLFDSKLGGLDRLDLFDLQRDPDVSEPSQGFHASDYQAHDKAV
jgi:hypothetical protein